MSAINKWTSPTWVSAGFTATDFNSLASGSCVVASTAISNSTDLDKFVDVSFSFVVGGTTTATSYFTLYLLPLNQDGTTYGDGTTTGTTPPTPTLQEQICTVMVGITSGNALVGMFRGVLLPPGDYKYCISDNLGVALNSAAAAAVQHRIYDDNLNG